MLSTLTVQFAAKFHRICNDEASRILLQTQIRILSQIKYTADIRWQKSRPVLFCVRMKNRCFIPEYLQSYLCEVTELCEVILF